MKLNASRIAQLLTGRPGAVCKEQLLLLLLQRKTIQLIIGLREFLERWMSTKRLSTLGSHLIEEIRLPHVEVEIVAGICRAGSDLRDSLCGIPVWLIGKNSDLDTHRCPVFVQFKVQV